jgi:AraC-like DNA-binding protein
MQHPHSRAGTAEKTFLLSELSELLSYISRHYTEDITIEDLCGVSNMSKSTLQRKMTAGIGYSPLQYVQRLRTSHAAVLLQDKSIPITEVATRSGYNSISSFNRCFINRFGVSPTQWQKNAN